MYDGDGRGGAGINMCDVYWTLNCVCGWTGLRGLYTYGLSCFDWRDTDCPDGAGDATNVGCCAGYVAENDFLGAWATGTG